MDRSIPTIPVKWSEVGLFVAIAVILGWIAGNPTATFEFGGDQPPPAIVELALQILIFALSPLIAVAVLIRLLRLEGGLQSFLRERFRWRISGRWYLVSIG